MPPAGIRNIALVAHVDHGKTTLVDAMLQFSGALADRRADVERVMDSNDQERERGITILAKAASLEWNSVRINLVDTPGHADFGGEVERALTMVDGALLLVDAAEGPLPQTRYVLSKVLAAGLRTVVVVNKVDRADARPSAVLDEIYELFLDLGATDDDIDFPVVSCVAKQGRAVAGIGMPDATDDLTALFDAILSTVPAPDGDPSAPLQALVTNLDASEYLGRLAIGRVAQGELVKGSNVALVGADPDRIVKRRLGSLMAFTGIGRADVERIGAGDLFVVSGFEEVEIGDTFADPDAPVALPRLAVDEPVLTMTFGPNTSPFAGRDGTYVTSRQVRERLEREVLGNVSIRLADTDTPDVIEVAGRGELQLAVLIESMRREGFELQVSRPEVIVRDIDGHRCEPSERGLVDIPDEHVGTVTQALAPRRGVVVDLRPGDPGRTVVTFTAPARGLIGFRSQLLTATRGTALLHTNADGWIRWAGDLPSRSGGAMIADRPGATTGYALDNLQARGQLFFGPGVDVYEGMVIGESARGDDMVVNVVREKQKTNIRTHSHDEGIKLAAAKTMTLEAAIEWIADDELVEVTPSHIRIRKRLLAEADRRRSQRRRS
ncbi:MAG: translational GTPase TypA [Actinobacteria bacterium]|nr:translational GTPase TypA [Actinomycetota bacterium]